MQHNLSVQGPQGNGMSKFHAIGLMKIKDHLSEVMIPCFFCCGFWKQELVFSVVVAFHYDTFAG